MLKPQQIVTTGHKMSHCILALITSSSSPLPVPPHLGMHRGILTAILKSFAGQVLPRSLKVRRFVELVICWSFAGLPFHPFCDLKEFQTIEMIKKLWPSLTNGFISGSWRWTRISGGTSNGHVISRRFLCASRRVPGLPSSHQAAGFVYQGSSRFEVVDTLDVLGLWKWAATTAKTNCIYIYHHANTAKFCVCV